MFCLNVSSLFAVSDTDIPFAPRKLHTLLWSGVRPSKLPMVVVNDYSFTLIKTLRVEEYWPKAMHYRDVDCGRPSSCPLKSAKLVVSWFACSMACSMSSLFIERG